MGWYVGYMLRFVGVSRSQNGCFELRKFLQIVSNFTISHHHGNRQSQVFKPSTDEPQHFQISLLLVLFIAMDRQVYNFGSWSSLWTVVIFESTSGHNPAALGAFSEESLELILRKSRVNDRIKSHELYGG